MNTQDISDELTDVKWHLEAIKVVERGKDCSKIDPELIEELAKLKANGELSKEKKYWRNLLLIMENQLIIANNQNSSKDLVIPGLKLLYNCCFLYDMFCR